MSTTAKIEVDSSPTIGQIYGAYLQAFAFVRSGGVIDTPHEFGNIDTDKLDILIAISMGAAHGRDTSRDVAPAYELLSELNSLSDFSGDSDACSVCGGDIDDGFVKPEVKPAS